MSDIERAMWMINQFFNPSGFTLLFCVIVPILSVIALLGDYVVKQWRHSLRLYFDGEDKLKNEELILEEEKPKRGRMMVGDDGELLEIVEEEFENEQISK